MSVDPKYFNVIKTPNDNNCLFRSLVIFLNSQLLSCRRNKEGRPVNKQLGEYENNCSRFLRETVVRMIKSRKNKYTGAEYYNSEHYSSIDDRITKMANEGVFGGKLEMDIISKMYKIKISVFIKFNGEYSGIYRSSLDNEDDAENQIKQVVDTDFEDYDYSTGDTCFLLLDNNNYQVLEPNFIQIKKDFPKKVMDKVIEEDTLSLQMENNENCENNKKFSFDVCNKDGEDYSDGFNQNITISISDRRLRPNLSSSNLSDSSFLNSSNNSFYNEDSGFEKIEINRVGCVSPQSPFQLKDTKLHDKLSEFNANNKHAILINLSPGNNKFIEIKENYKDLCFNDLVDIISSIE